MLSVGLLPLVLASGNPHIVPVSLPWGRGMVPTGYTCRGWESTLVGPPQVCLESQAKTQDQAANPPPPSTHTSFQMSPHAWLHCPFKKEVLPHSFPSLLPSFYRCCMSDILGTHQTTRHDFRPHRDHCLVGQVDNEHTKRTIRLGKWSEDKTGQPWEVIKKGLLEMV